MLLEEYLQELSAVSEKEELTNLLVRAFSDFGAKAIVGHALSFGGSNGILEWDPIFTTFPQSIADAYAKYRQAGDPFFDAALAYGAPVHFHRIRRQIDWSGPQSHLITEMEGAGLHDGVAAFVIIKPGVAAYFVAAFSEIHESFSAAALRRIHIMFSEFYFRYREISRKERVSLSQREQQILIGIIAGKSNTEIGTQLAISKATVDTYVRRCFEKLKVSSRMEAALKFFSLGLQPGKSAE